jgi:hypothetical protein
MLRTPDAYGNAERWRFVHSIHLDLTLHDHYSSSGADSEVRKGCTTFRVLYSPEIEHETQREGITNQIQAYLAGELTGEDAKYDDDDEEVSVGSIGLCERISRPLRMIFWDENMQNSQRAKSWEHDRIRLLHSFVNWMILLFNTDWTEHACCCEIRFQEMDNREIQFVLFEDAQRQCQNSLARGRKLLLLGLVLAEVIL